ncbi:unnamed protein product [Rhizoctonia solani]|uniref:Uncharacterized protein n=1 Tax=Rhizoctonia solani TaxID=456999 RepID=A0A8H3H478_9AGAM|nr:unnamed protein product [Rhizoctonia solani]
MTRGRTNSVVAPTPLIVPGPVDDPPNGTYQQAFWYCLQILVDTMLMVYLAIITLAPWLDGQPDDSRGVTRRQIVAGPRRGRRRGSVEAGPPVVHHDLERHGEIQVIDGVRRLARKVLPPLLAIMICMSIMLIIGATPMSDAIQALANLSSGVIQIESIETEVPGASCLGAAHSGTENFTVQRQAP